MTTLKSYAKLNLFLKITGKNKQNYHNLFSLFSTLSLHDIITINEQNAGLELSFKGKYAKGLEDLSLDHPLNIIAKAFKVLKDKYDIHNNFTIEIEKNIPHGSGLGGGSSNAAQIIKFCNSYFKLQMTKEEMIKISASIGADIPFFIEESAMICEGIGDIMTPFPYINKIENHILLVYPSTGCDTKKVFSITDKITFTKDTNKYKNQLLDPKLTSAALTKMLISLSNDLTPLATSFCPDIKNILDAFKQHKIEVYGMSGSGSSCFALLNSDSKLQELKEHFSTTSYDLISTTLL